MKRVMLCYEHYHCDTNVDIYLPPPEGTNIYLGQPPSEDADVTALGEKHRPICPVCGKQMTYAAWSVEDLRDELENP